MEARRIKLILISAFLLCAGMVATCEYAKQDRDTGQPNQDTVFLSQWRREKQERLHSISVYEKKVSLLQTSKDSLLVILKEKKQSLANYRFKASKFAEDLQESIVEADTNRISPVSLRPTVDSLILAQQSADKACDETIGTLENEVSNRDSSLIFHRQIEDNLRDLGKQEELRTEYLTSQLEAALKGLRKKSRQNKLLSAGILVFSGLTASLFVTQALK